MKFNIWDGNQKRKPNLPNTQKDFGKDLGPAKPKIGQPRIPSELIKRMKNIDPDQARRYRQRSGE